MDAEDAQDDNKDVQLYKSSRDLLPEIRSQLPLLVKANGTTRCWVLYTQVEELTRLLDRFQEWPQLLDQDLPFLVSTLIEAFTEYLQHYTGSYELSAPIEAAVPLPRAVCRLLYSLCKVRGQKVIVRFFYNEARYIDPILRAFCLWTSLFDEPGDGTRVSITWEEKYIMLLWLSHLTLTPFNLESVSSYVSPTDLDLSIQLPDGLPGVSKALIAAANAHIFCPGKERDSACALLIRLSLRPDMQRLGLLKSVLKMASAVICDVSDNASATIYRKMGAIAIFATVFKLGLESDIAPFIRNCFTTIRQAVENQDIQVVNRSDAYTRRLLIKTVRIILVRSLTSTLAKYLSPNLDGMINFAIEYFVSSLSDKDTPVRIEASKATSLCTLKLGPPDDASIVEGMIDMLESGVRFEDTRTGRPLKTPIENDVLLDLTGVTRNVERVDGLQWHGIMLALARLLLHRSLELHLLPAVVQTLISGLDFEQRSSKGAAFGTQIRDAACFGLWALSRKYNTAELTSQGLSGQSKGGLPTPLNLVKHVASSLMICACFDPQGNMRRGASAALQELIGRHPDVVEHGISCVQLIDYQGVASRKRAMFDISFGVALLHRSYWFDLSRAALTWRGIGAVDAASRRAAAAALYRLGQQAPPEELKSLYEHILAMLRRLPAQGSVDKRHGWLLALSAVIDASRNVSFESEHRDARNAVSANATERMWLNDAIADLCDDVEFGSPLLGREASFGMPRNLLYYSSAKLIGSIAFSANVGLIQMRSSSQNKMVDTLLKCTRNNDEETAHVIVFACEQLFRTLSESEKVLLVTRLGDMAAAPSLGSLMAMAGAYKCHNPKNGKSEEDTSIHHLVYSLLRQYVGNNNSVETKCSAWQSLREIVVLETQAPIREELSETVVIWISEIHIPLKDALDDYTTDHRGDVGSWVRLEAVKFLEQLVTNWFSSLDLDKVSPLIGSLIRMAAERLDKVRLQAWKSLTVCWKILRPQVLIDDEFIDERDVSGTHYFTQLLSRFFFPYARELIKGYVTSFSGGAEGLAIATRSALLSFSTSQKEGSHGGVNDLIFEQALICLMENKQDERYAIPSLHFIAFLLDQGLVPSQTNFVKCFAKVELAHFRSSNSARLEGALLCYGGLLLQPSSRGKALKKVQMLQKHPQTKIRSLADEILQLYE